MKLCEAIIKSPTGEAVRATEDGRVVHWRKGDPIAQERPNYALWIGAKREDVRGHEDWMPAGWMAPDPVAVTLTDVTDGWLAPDGTFYRTGYSRHVAAAAGILTEVLGAKPTATPDDVLIESGWVMMRHKAWYQWSWDLRPTQRQLDAAWDWARANGEKLPEWFIEDQKPGPLVAPGEVSLR